MSVTRKGAANGRAKSFLILSLGAWPAARAERQNTMKSHTTKGNLNPSRKNATASAIPLLWVLRAALPLTLDYP